MRMNDKIKTLKEKLQKMKVNRGNRQTGQMFHFSPFSKKQKQVLTWWCKESPVHSKDGIIADGAIRSGKNNQHVTVICNVGYEFVSWQQLCNVWKDHRFLQTKCSVLAKTDAPFQRVFRN